MQRSIIRVGVGRALTAFTSGIIMGQMLFQLRVKRKLRTNNLTEL